jgi:DNA-binding response OmpR family regulator
MKRNSGSAEKRIYNDKNLMIDFSERKASLNGNTIDLSNNEYNLLYILMKNSQMVLTRRILLEKLWDRNENFVDENALTMMISRIRTKIDTTDKKHVKTIYGMGYQWIGEPYDE